MHELHKGLLHPASKQRWMGQGLDTQLPLKEPERAGLHERKLHTSLVRGMQVQVQEDLAALRRQRNLPGSRDEQHLPPSWQEPPSWQRPAAA